MNKALEERLTNPANLMQPCTQTGTIYLPLKKLPVDVKTNYLGIDFTFINKGEVIFEGSRHQMIEINLKAHNTHAFKRCSHLFEYKDNHTLLPHDLRLVFNGDSSTTTISRRFKTELPIGDIVALREYYFRTKFSRIYNNDPSSNNCNMNKVRLWKGFVKEITEAID